jgi:hypothetical protein
VNWARGGVRQFVTDSPLIAHTMGTISAVATQMNEPGKSVAKIREEACRRLDELAPVIEEAERLRSVLAVLDAESGQPGGDEDPDRSALLEPRAKPDHVRADKDVILAIIAEHPGITAAEIAQREGMKRTVVATTIARMKRHGQLIPDGKGARLPDPGN